MNKFLAAVFASVILLFPNVSSAQRLQDSVGVDRFAHAGISYLINDQLKRNAKMNDFWAATTTLAIGALKEISDGKWDNGDFIADSVGVFMYQIKF